jgi:hypothetical protein
MVEIALAENSIEPIRPARSALACAARIAPASLSDPIILGMSETITFEASANKSSQYFESK